MITLLTIGQTPREDLKHPFQEEQFEEKLNIKGALDELTDQEIQLLEKKSNNDQLFVRTRNRDANIAHEYIETELQKLVKDYELVSKAIVILCMGEFNCQSKKVQILQPIQEMKLQVKEIEKSKRVLIFIPVDEQCDDGAEKWSEIKAEKIIQTVTPGTEQTFEEMNSAIKKYSPDIVLLDCYGYSWDFPEKLEQVHSKCKVYGPQQLIIKKLKQIIN